MAKIPFSKLAVKADTSVNIVNWGEYQIEVHKVLPISDKITMINNILNQAADDNGFYNPVKVEVYLTLEALYVYTNITFTDKQKENVLKLYDAVVSSGLFALVVEAIDEDDWANVRSAVYETISNVYEYKNSVMGILDILKEDYSALNFDATSIQEKLADPDNIQLLRDVMAKLG